MVKFSVIIPIFNSEEYLKECLDSILAQTFDDFEIICINDGSTDNSEAILNEYANKDNRVKAYSQEHKGQGAARNWGIELAEGEYLSFIDSDDKISKNTLKSVHDFFENNDEMDIASIPIYYFNEKNHALNYKFDRKNDPEDRVVDLIETPEAIQSSAPSSFIRAKAIMDLRFDEDLIADEGLVFINRILLLKNKIGLVKNAEYYYRRANDEALSKTAKYAKGYYNYRIKCLNELIDYSIKKEGKVPRYIQNIVVFSLRELETVSDFPESMTKEEINEFWENIYELLSHIDKESIYNQRIIKKKKLYFSHFLMYLKNRKDFRIEKDGEGNTQLKTGEVVINTLNKNRIFFDIVELKDKSLNLSGNIVSSCKNETLRVEAVKSQGKKKEVYQAKYIEYPRTNRSTDRYLGIDWKFNYNFELKIPIEKNKTSKISFNGIYEEGNEKVVMDNKLDFRRFAEISKFSYYYIRGSRILVLLNNSLNIIPYSYKQALRLEISSSKKILLSNQKHKFQALFYRWLYLLLLPKMKDKEIYMFMDRRESIGDNGEHLFRYAVEQNDNVRKYFALEKDSKEFKKLKKEFGSKILEFGSFKHKLIYMFTDKFLGSQGYKKYINPFSDRNMKLVQNISSPPVYFLQHGVGKYNMTSWLRKYDINFSLLLTVSDLDQEAFVNNYHYDEEIIQELGFPRYDNLTNDNLKKEIVIIPTWRKGFTSEEKFLNSEYFLRWNSLLNNEELNDFVKEKGYKIVYKPHPNSMKFLHLFNTENVEVDNQRRFHDILCESAVMITDYSSVNFDFAYLKKPIIYYQYGDDYHFEGDALIDEEASTFGDKIKDEKILIEKIKEYLENDCKMEEKYIEKVESFFKYTDKNNCKRVYDWVLKH